MFRPLSKNAFPLIITLSVVLRLFSAFYQGNTVDVLPGTYDQISYHTLATRVLNGYGFSFGTGWWPATPAGAPTAHWSYLYTLYLVFVYFVFGVNPLAARLLQSLTVGILQPWLCYRIGARLCGDKIGLLATVLTVIYGYFVYYAGSLMTESFFLVAVLWVMDIATILAANNFNGKPMKNLTWLSLGMAFSLAILLRQVFLLFAPFLGAWFIYVLGSGGYRERLGGILRGILIAFSVMILMIFPWTVRNYFAFNRFVLLNTNAGFAFFWANHPIHGTEFEPIFHDNGLYGTLIPKDLLKLDEASMDRQLLQEGLHFVAQDPQRYLRLSLSRAKEYFRFWPSKKSSLASNMVRLFSFGLLFPFMIIGLMVISFTSFKQRDATANDLARSGHILLSVFAVSYTLIHLLTWSLIRYRLPVDSVLVLYAAAGALWLANRFSVFKTLPVKEPAV
jgi:4-amino-4-deoxy-L-arabinose transferase-like glycosyltransferase